MPRTGRKSSSVRRSTRGQDLSARDDLPDSDILNTLAEELAALAVSVMKQAARSRGPSPVNRSGLPEELETFSMPTHDALGLHEHEAWSPILPEPRGKDPEQTVAWAKPGALNSSSERHGLVPKGQVFKGKFGRARRAKGPKKREGDTKQHESFPDDWTAVQLKIRKYASGCDNLGAPVQAGEVSRMKVADGEGLANRTGPGSCAGLLARAAAKR
jgi:hypothetical protein